MNETKYLVGYHTRGDSSESVILGGYSSASDARNLRDKLAVARPDLEFYMEEVEIFTTHFMPREAWEMLNGGS